MELTLLRTWSVLQTRKCYCISVSVLPTIKHHRTNDRTRKETAYDATVWLFRSECCGALCSVATPAVHHIPTAAAPSKEGTLQMVLQRHLTDHSPSKYSSNTSSAQLLLASARFLRSKLLQPSGLDRSSGTL